MTTTFKHLSLVTASLLFIGCGGGGSTSNGGSVNNPTPSPIINDKTNPIFQTNTSLSKKENIRYITDVQASDQTELEYTIEGGVDKDKFAIDKYNGTLIFKDKPDYENPRDIEGDNIYEVTIQVTDLGNNSTSKDFTISIEDENETVANTYNVQDLNNSSNTYNIGTSPRSVYVLLSNESKTVSSNLTVTHSKIAQTQKRKKESSIHTPSIHAKRGRHAPAYIQAFNKNVKKLLKSTNTTRESKIVNTNPVPQKKDTVNTSKIFYTSENTSSQTFATAKKVVSNISTAFGPKTLNIWVSNDSFGAGCQKTKCVTQAMVDALAETFLKSGESNDIYDWVTHIYGEEWEDNASVKYNNIIGANDEITILLTDIDDDNNENGGVIGYFYSKDNYKKTNTSDGSNERVMFYIDAVMFANGDGESWSIDHAWPKEVVSTLAHEFVHMIEFYQKTVLLGAGSETWLAEMLAESTEDMVATKIKHKGPRGVDHEDGSAGSAKNEEGRYGLFNENNTLSLTTWTSALSDYSKVNAYGAFLIRNYGGAKLLHDMMHNEYEDEQAVVYAVNKPEEIEGKTFATLQKEWGIAVLLSDQENLTQDTPTYNTGDFTVSQMGDVVYKMGSINFFNYNPQPSFSKCTTVNPQANCYYKVGDNLTGEVNIDLTLDATTSATLIVK